MLKRLYLLLIMLIALGLPTFRAAAQERAITFEGAVEAVNLNLITVDQLVVDVSTIQITMPLEIGVIVRVEGMLLPNNRVRAVQIAPLILAPNELELIGVVTSLDGNALVIGGQAVNITNAALAQGIVIGQRVIVRAAVIETGALTASSVLIFHGEDDDDDKSKIAIIGILEEVQPEIVIVSGLSLNRTTIVINNLVIGAIIKTHVHLNNGQFVIIDFDDLTELDDIEFDDAIIVIEGPVQVINTNIITIYNIEVQLSPNNPILVGLVPGDILHVEGNFVQNNTTIIIVAINVFIVHVHVDINIDTGGNGGGDDDDDDDDDD